MEFHKIGLSSARQRRESKASSAQKALDYLVGEKFLNFLEAAETDRQVSDEIPAFVAEIKSIFEGWHWPNTGNGTGDGAVRPKPV